MRWLLAAVVLMSSPLCRAGVISPFGARWDAAPRIVGGNERSLAGGLRYSVSGGSYQAFRDQFSWNSVPTVTAFQQAVDQAFGAWTSVDPVSGFGTSIQFVSDFSTPVVTGSGFGTLNINGAEIDLIASDAGGAGLGGLTAVSSFGTPVTLTSGVAGYASSVTIQGVDLHLNNNSAAVYSLDAFRRLLTHELGHALGLGDVDLGGTFLDDNYSASDPLGTLTNSWADLVNPLDPANSVGLSTFSVPGSQFALSGVDILMESNGLGIGPTNPLSNLVPLTNDDYGTRQFLYPELVAVPEPRSLLVLAALSIAGLYRRRKSHRVA
ncbi:MAG: hypothetical protein R3C19_20685 [Planctomycetaceae bacterium]